MSEPSQEARDLAAIVSQHIGGADDPADPHSWRCYDKERYPGDCGCVADLVEDLLPVIAKARSSGIDEFLTRKAIERRFRGMRP